MTVEALNLPRQTSGWQLGRARRRLQLARRLPYLFAAAVVIGTSLLAWQVSRQDHEQVQAEVAVAAAGARADLESEVRWHVQSFERMAHRWGVWGTPQAPDWSSDAALHFEHFPALAALGWLGDDGSVRWQSTRDAVAEGGGIVPLVDGALVGVLRQALADDRPVFAAPVGPPGVQRLLPLYVPIAGSGSGLLLALFDSRYLLDAILADQLVLGYGLDVALYGVPIYGAGAVAGPWLRSHRLEVFGAPWVLRVWPGPALLSQKRSWLPAGVFGGGLLLSAALAVSAAFARRVRRHAAELEHARAELQRSNSELEQFAYVASHDLQEPLRQVASFLGLLERRYGSELEGEAHEFIVFAVDGAHRLQQLVNDLLTYSRVGSRGRTPEPTDPASALGCAVADLRQAIEESRALVTDDGPFPPVLVDPRQLALVFQNLLSNAIKYAGDSRPLVHVSARRTGQHVEISVRDHGIGIEPRFFDRIFVIFQRLHTRERYPGTGIGLAVVRRVVEQHGGRVWVESEPGEGAAFHFTLPAAEIEPEP